MFQLFSRMPKELPLVRPVSAGQRRILGVLNSFDITWKWTDAIPLLVSSIVPPFVTETWKGNWSLLSNVQVRKAKPICLRLFMQFIRHGGRRSAYIAGTNAATSKESTATMIKTSGTVRPPTEFLGLFVISHSSGTRNR